MKRLEKPFNYDGGNYYTPQDREIISQICNKEEKDLENNEE